MSKKLMLSKIIASIVEPDRKVPLAKFMPSYPVRFKELEEVFEEVLAADDMPVLSWLTDCFEGELLEYFLQGMQTAYEDTLQIYRAKGEFSGIDRNFADGLQVVYCFLNKLPVNETTRADAVKYFMSSRRKSKLGYVIIAYGVAFLISLAFAAKMIKLNNRKPRLRTSFECQQCGRCCLKHGNCLSATDEDIELWERTGRSDILEWVDAGGDLWINQSTHKEAARCPWLRKLPGKNQYLCRIHETKPEICRNYPVMKKQALEDGCPGLKG